MVNGSEKEKGKNTGAHKTQNIKHVTRHLLLNSNFILDLYTNCKKF